MPVIRSFFQRIPFIRITSLFLIGILLNHFLKIDFHWIGMIIALLISIQIFLWHNSHYSGIKIQNLLNQAIDRIGGAKIKVNGFYGTATVAAVAVIQKLKFLKVSGLIGPKTLIAIKEVSMQQRPDSF